MPSKPSSEQNRLRESAYLLNADGEAIIKAALEASEKPMDQAAALMIDAAKSGTRGSVKALKAQAAKLFPKLAETMPTILAVADMNGRKAFLEDRKARKQSPLGTPPLPASSGDPALPDYLTLPFTAAIDALVEREPELANSREEVADVYQRYGFAVAKSMSVDFTARVQKKIARSLLQGTDGLNELRKEFEDAGLSRAYASTVYRTNVKNATSAGRQQQAMRDGSGIIAWLYVAVGDTDTRSNHLLMDGFMASIRSKVWRKWTPPNGYNCRCGLEEIDEDEAERLGRLDKDGKFIDDPPRNLEPDPGFAGSPSRFVGYE